MKLNPWKNKGLAGGLARLLKGREAGPSVKRAGLEMIPLFGGIHREYAPPETALELEQVTDYGRMILKNRSRKWTIVPLHMGYFQFGAQNHAMCRSYILKPGERKEFKDAACIQAAQGGYIKEADRRFIVLPQPLRGRALALKGVKEYGKLWKDIERFNQSLGLKHRGHLDELKQARQPELLRTVYFLETQPEQTGAVFLNRGRVVGLELAPGPGFWKELHLPLVMYCYAPLRLHGEPVESPAGDERRSGTFAGARTPDEVETLLREMREARMEMTRSLLRGLGEVSMKAKREQSAGEHELFTIDAGEFRGQAVLREGEPAYVSLTAV